MVTTNSRTWTLTTSSIFTQCIFIQDTKIYERSLFFSPFTVTVTLQCFTRNHILFVSGKYVLYDRLRIQRIHSYCLQITKMEDVRYVPWVRPRDIINILWAAIDKCILYVLMWPNFTTTLNAATVRQYYSNFGYAFFSFTARFSHLARHVGQNT